MRSNAVYIRTGCWAVTPAIPPVRALRNARKLIYMRPGYGLDYHKASHPAARRVGAGVTALQIVFSRSHRHPVAEAAAFEAGQIVFLAPHLVNVVAIL